MSFELTGKLVEKFDIMQITESFQKREFVVETSEQGGGREYFEQIKFQLIQDKCSLIDNFNIGQDIKVNFNIKGRKWEKDGRSGYFTNLDAWRVEPLDNANIDLDAPPPPDEDAFMDDNDDLPF